MEKVTSYIKNLGKSMQYAAIDEFKEIAPSINSFTETNSELFKEINDTVRNRRTMFKRTRNAMERSKIYDASKQMKQSIFEDISSGKFYNKDRKDSGLAFGGMDDGFGDFDMDSMSFGEEDGEIPEISADGTHISDTIGQHSQASAEAISNTIAKSAEYIVETQQAQNEFMMMNNMQTFGKMNAGIDSINQNISNIISFNNGAAKAHYENSTAYYKETTSILKESNALLKELVEMERNRYGKELDKEKEKKGPRSYDDIVDANGVVDIKEYAKMVRRNIANNSGGAGDMMNMFGDDTNIFMTFAESPLEFIPKMLVKSLMGPQFKASIKRLDKSVANFFGALTLRFNTMAKNDGNMIEQTIGKIFGIESGLKNSLGTEKYNKEAIQWDGVAKKALTEVIPTYLAQIVSLLGGSPAKVYDYNKGKFIDSAQLKKDYDRILGRNVESSMMDFRSEMERMAEATIAFTNKQTAAQDRKNFQKDLDSFMTYFFTKGEMFDYNNKSLSDYEGLSMSNANNMAIIEEMFKSMQNNMQLGFSKSIVEGRADHNRKMNNMEKEANNVFTQLFNESGIFNMVSGATATGNSKKSMSPLVNVKDNLGNNIFYYLSKITKTLLEGIKVFPISGKRGKIPDGILNRDTNLNNINSKDRTTDSTKENASSKIAKNEAKKLANSNIMLEYGNIDPDSMGAYINSLDISNRVYEAKGQQKKKGLIDQLLGDSLSGKFNTMRDKMSQYTQTPVKAITDIFDAVDMRLHQLVYGGKERKYKGQTVRGFLDMMMVDIQNVFEKFNNWLDDNVLKPISERFNKDKVLGGANNILKDVFGFDANTIRESLFGRDIVDADGNLIREDGYLSGIGGQVKSDLKGGFDTAKGGLSDLFMRSKGYSGIETKYGNKVYSAFAKDQSIYSKVWDELAGILGTTKNVMFGKGSMFKSNEQIELDMGDTFKGLLSEFQDKNKKFIPKMASGALIGGGVALLPGIIGGPLLGAGLGAATAMVKNSDTLMNALFGEADENGIRGGNLVPKKIIDAFEKYAPDMKKYGLGGSLLSIMPFVPGGPVAGLMIGSAMGFAKNNQNVQNFLFGEEGIFSEETKANIDKFVPKGIAGAILGGISGHMTLGSLLGGPFGMVGGAVLGASLNILGSTDKFGGKINAAIFGTYDEKSEQNENGLIPMLRDSVVTPVKNGIISTFGNIKGFISSEIVAPFKAGMDPFVKEFQLMGKGIKDIFTGALDKVFTDSFGAPLHDLIDKNIITPFRNFFTKIFTALGKVAGSIISSPIKAFTYMSNELKVKHVKQGNATYMNDKEIDEFKNNNPFRFPLFAMSNFFDNIFNTVDDIESEGGKESGGGRKRRSLWGIVREQAGQAFTAAGQDVRSQFESFQGYTRDVGASFKSLFQTMAPSKNRGAGRSNARETGGDDDKEGDSTSSYTSSSNDKFQSLLNERDDKIKGLETQINALIESNKKRDEQDRDDEKRFRNRERESLHKNVALIASEVKGQMDGLGYNMETVKNILEENLGSPENEATGIRTGRGNRKRKGIFRRFIDFMKNPVGAAKNVVKTILVGKDGESGIFGFAIRGFKGVVNTITTIITAPFKAVKAVIQGVGFALNGMVEAVKMVGPAIGTVIKSAVEIAVSPIKALGKVIEGFGAGLGEAVKGIMGGVGTLAGSILELSTVVPKLAKGFIDLTATVGGLALDLVKFVGGGIANGLGYVAQGVFGKMMPKVTERKIVLAGGFIDTVKVVETVGSVDDSPSVNDSLKDVEETIKGTSQDSNNNMDDIFDETSSINNKIGKIIEAVKTAMQAKMSNQNANLPMLPTEHGMVRYDVDASGVIEPIVDAPFTAHQKALTNQREQQLLLTNSVVANLEESKKITENTSVLQGFKNAFDDIISKVGIAALGIAGAVGVIQNWDSIKGVLDKIWGFLSGEGTDNRTEEDGNIIPNYDLRERLTTQAGKRGIIGLNSGIKFIDNVGSKAIKAGRFIGTNAKKVGTGIANIAGAGFNKAKNFIDNAIPKNAVKASADDAFVQAQKGMMKAMGLEVAEESAEGLGSKFVKALTGFIETFFKSSKVKKEMGEKAAKEASEGILKKISKSFTKNVLNRFFPKITAAMARFAGETAADAATVGISVAAFAIWDFSTGAFEAARLFKVNQDAVDWKMRVIASLVKGLFGLGNIAPIIDIGSEILVEVTGFDLKQTIANTMYDAMSSDDNSAVLRANQNAFKAEYDEYIRETGEDISLNAYNDKMNKTVAGKIGSGIKNTWTTIKTKTEEAVSAANTWYGNFRDTWPGRFLKNMPFLSIFDLGWDLANNGVQGVIQSRVIDPFNKVKEGITTFITETIPAMNTWYGGFRETGVGNAIMNLPFLNVFDLGWDLANNGFESVVQTRIKDPFNNMYDGIKTFIEEKIPEMNTWYGEWRETSVGNAIMNLPGLNIFDIGWEIGNFGVDGMLQNRLSGVKQLFNGIKDLMKQMLEDMWKEIKDTPAGKMIIAVGETAASAKEWADGVGEDIGNAASQAGDWIKSVTPNWLGGNKGNTSSGVSTYDPGSINSMYEAPVMSGSWADMGYGIGGPVDADGNKESYNNYYSTASSNNVSYDGNYYSGVNDGQTDTQQTPTNIFQQILKVAESFITATRNKESVSFDDYLNNSTSAGSYYSSGNALTNNEFVNSIKSGAIKGYKDYKVWPSITVAQAILESAWGKSSIGNNIFGIKAGSSWNGPKQYVMTHEYENGMKINKKQWFRDYPSIDASIMDHAKLLGTSGYYSKFRDATNYVDAANALTGVYATDPKYGSKLIDIINNNGLDNLDMQALGYGNSVVPNITTNFADTWFGSNQGYRKTSDFGYRTQPAGEDKGKRKFHHGIDYAAPIGSPIRTPVGGTISAAGYSGGFGNRIHLLDDNGNTHTFGHLSKILRNGGRVNAGETIGLMGSTGNSTGSHLHYAISKGNYYSSDSTDRIDPNEYMQAIGYKKQAQVTRPVKGDEIGGDGEDPKFLKLMTVLSELLNKIVINTSNIGEIVRLLADGLNVTLTDEQVKSLSNTNIINNPTSKGSSPNKQPNAELNDLVNSISAMAME